ncbi:hypothetical protein CR162_20550 [Pseudoroseomonas rhizosphaerae]|uniref:DUF1622 domain-containing protein n=1 Tax=Teichococcus rhizosphaerae TaxID=1335062 RepID=A0A2C6Z3G2_9PROT|nr:DUF1622 domain-containing protein [Pseudoroseomonas rhizosphaerae]PHK93061.1 hypothetical protein CR162_20550 [Pseudoroseomonas rhizosphaerae]
MEEMVLRVIGWVVLAVEVVAALIVAGAAAEGAWRVLALLRRRAGAARDAAKQAVRLHLARWLMVALEFTLAADILRTVVAPSWDDIGQLAAIATLRTVLNLFLEREIAQAGRKEAALEMTARGGKPAGDPVDGPTGGGPTPA